MSTPAPAARASTWPDAPASPASMTTLQPYLEHYRDWLVDELQPVLARLARQLRDDAKRNEFMTWVDKEWRGALPRSGGHVADAGKSGLGVIAGEVAATAWIGDALSAECVAFLASPAAHRSRGEAFGETLGAVCGLVGPLHVAEAMVRKDARMRLTAHTRDLPGLARPAAAALDRGQVKNLGQKYCREAMLGAVDSYDAARAVAVRPPLEDMQRAWLAGVWPGRRNAILAIAELEGPEVREAITRWLASFEEAHEWLRTTKPSTRRDRRRDDVTDEDRASWEGYIWTQLECIADYLLPKGPDAGYRRGGLIKPGDDSEIIDAALSRAVRRMRRWRCQPTAERSDTIWWTVLISALQDERRAHHRRWRQEISLDGIAEGSPDAAEALGRRSVELQGRGGGAERGDPGDPRDAELPDDSAFTALHKHLGLRWMRHVASHDAGSAAGPGLDRVIRSCLDSGAACHGSAIDGALRHVVGTEGGDALVDEVLHHVTTSPGAFLPLGETPDPALADVVRALEAYGPAAGGPEPRPHRGRGGGQPRGGKRDDPMAGGGNVVSP